MLKRCLIGSLALHGVLLVGVSPGLLFVRPRPAEERPVVFVNLVENAGKLPGAGGKPVATKPALKPRSAGQVVTQAPVRPAVAQQKSGTAATTGRATRLPAEALVPVVRNAPRVNPATTGAAKVQQENRDVRLAVSEDVRPTVERPGGAAEPLPSGQAASVEHLSDSYANDVKAAYSSVWLPPDELTDDQVMAEVEIVVKRDGTVHTADIATASGNALMDRSVRFALERVQFIREFPAGWKAERKTFRIKFHLKVKELLAG